MDHYQDNQIKESILSISAEAYRFDGISYRSLTEARWAKLFKSFNINFEYEKKTYKTSIGGYMPDFYFPDLKCHLEVKPTRPTHDKGTKLRDVVNSTELPGYFLCGFPVVEDRSLTGFEVIQLKPGKKDTRLNLHEFNHAAQHKHFWPLLLSNIALIRKQIKTPLIQTSSELLHLVLSK